MPKAKEKSIIIDEEEEETLHGAVNLEEARKHTMELEKSMDIIEEGVRAGNTEGLLEEATKKIKTALVEIAPHMETAKIDAVLKAIKDMACTVLMPPDSDKEETLEAMMPETETPALEDFLSSTEDLGDITADQKELLGELFEELETAHESLARACSTLGRLSRVLSGKQLLLTLRASMRPLVQLNIVEKFWKDPAQKSKKTDLPDDLHHRIALTMIPDASAKSIKRESGNSPTRLLAATLAFHILKQFGQGTTQQNMQELYEVKPKQMALCITGRKYLGGAERSARKRRASGEEPSTSSQQ